MTDWENLIPMQDPRRVTTIEEYKNKLYRYSLTEYSIKIERMTVELENLFSSGNTLSSSLLKRLDSYLQDSYKMMFNDNLKEISEWWSNLQEDFKRLNQNYSDYLHTFYSVSGEKLLRSIDFIQHKDKFIEYLRDFIRVLQKYSGIIEKALLAINNESRDKLIEKILLSELELPHTNTEILDIDKIRTRLKGQWQALYGWFISNDSKPSVCSMAMEYTNEIIRKILSNAVMLMQLQNSGISRKQDYKKYMSMFAKCKSLSNAHCLSAHVFGAMNTAHFKYNIDKDSDSISENVIDLVPQIFEVQPKTRIYKPKIKTVGFSNNQLEKSAKRMAQINKIQQEQQMIESYIKDNKIDVANLEDKIVPNEFRISLLKWIAAANQNKKRTGITDFGLKFHIIKSDKRTVLHCSDGDLNMPAYIIEFEVSDDE
ncbi:MAG: TIGR02677 family protein [Oscillospiraceae bacterium]